MTIDIAFAELIEYVWTHYGKKLAFSRVSSNEICVYYEMHVFITTIQIPVNVTIDEVLPDTVALTYSGKMGIDKIISGMLIYLKAKAPQLESILNIEEGHHIRICLTGQEATKKVLETVNLKDIQIFENTIRVTAELK